MSFIFFILLYFQTDEDKNISASDITEAKIKIYFGLVKHIPPSVKLPSDPESGYEEVMKTMLNSMSEIDKGSISHSLIPKSLEEFHKSVAENTPKSAEDRSIHVEKAFIDILNTLVSDEHNEAETRQQWYERLKGVVLKKKNQESDDVHAAEMMEQLANLCKKELNTNHKDDSHNDWLSFWYSLFQPLMYGKDNGYLG